MYRWLHKRKSKLFFHETGLDLIILLKFLFLWNIWPFYKITCIFTFITEVRVEPDPRTLIRGHWREPRLVSSLLLFCQVSRIYMSMWDICHLHQFCYRIKLYFRILGTMKYIIWCWFIPIRPDTVTKKIKRILFIYSRNSSSELCTASIWL